MRDMASLTVPHNTRYEQEIASFIRQHDRMAIVGLGNEYRTDDGVGVAAIRLLEDEVVQREEVALFDADRNLVRYLPEIEEFKPSGLLFIDAANLGIEPGRITVLDENQIIKQSVLTHDNNLGLAMAYVRMALPECGVLFVGIQFKLLDMSEELTLTNEIREAVTRLVRLIAEALLDNQS